MITECPICDRELGLDEEEHVWRCLDKRIVAAVAEERERCIKAGWAEICRQENYEAWPTEEGFVAAIRVQP